MSAISRHVTADVTSNVGLGLVAAHIAIRDTLDGVRIRRAEAADSVSELVIRLREARNDQHAAEQRAVAAEARAAVLARALQRMSAEAAGLRDALNVEREFAAGLREIIGA
ncbi:hypothetical protein FV242_31400 [Methylobacterium sp. WL64]|uniref:hypothetical protein n=1 Tax=Methylobacterium sp. WL64 TaxID=2603894 RepID=UPI0011CC8340|nr:hypothetical protein [Methylobacterium sp. WL64]TXM97509.1 hypothetical protein FV242_31400 [Methylobacterium sp. WL64]